MSIRSIQNQLNHAFDNCLTVGISKRGAKASGIFEDWMSFSNRRYKEIKSIIRQFSNWYKDNYPSWNVLVCDVTADDWQRWVEYKQLSGDWVYSTARETVSVIGKLGDCVNHTFYGVNVDWRIGVRALPMKTGKVKKHSMSDEDIRVLSAAMMGVRSGARYAVEITNRTGLRVDEVAHLRGDRIDLNNEIVDVVEGMKNNRVRFVPIREEDVDFFRFLNGKYGDDYVCGGILAESVDARVRKEMKVIESPDGTGRTLAEKYPLETLHAIRKNYARKRMDEELKTGLSINSAWNNVLDELGHGEDREDLFDTYIGEKFGAWQKPMTKKQKLQKSAKLSKRRSRSVSLGAVGYQKKNPEK